MSLKNINSRISIDDIYKILPKKQQGIIDILETLKKYPEGLTRKEIQTTLKINNSEQRKLEYWLEELININYISVSKDEDTIYKKKFILNQSNGFNIQFTYNSYDFKNFIEWIELLSTYEYVPFIEDIIHVISEQNNNSTPKPKYINFNQVKYIGTENFKSIYEASKGHYEISFKYKRFNEKGRNEVIKEFSNLRPYLLKEHNKRWYLVGKFAKDLNWKIFSLDRIEGNIESHIHKKFTRERINIKSIWEYSSGIYPFWKKTDDKDDSTAKIEYNPIKISFLFKDGNKYDNVRYLESNKIHPSQEISENSIKLDKKEGNYFQVNLFMFPDTDLVREIRRIGLHCIEKIEPDFLDNWVRNG